MAVPLGTLGTLDLDIPTYRNASLVAVFERTEKGDYTFDLAFGGAYAAWSGKDVPEAIRAQYDQSYDSELENNYVRLNPVIRGDVEFGGRLLGKTRNGQFSIAVKMSVNGKEQKGKVWTAVDDAEIMRIINQAEQLANMPECDA